MLKTNPSKKFLSGIVLLVVLATGIPIILSQSQVRQILTGQAWYTSQSASAVCLPSSSNVYIKVSFTNKESYKGMNVKAVDTQTGKSVDLGTVSAGKTNTGQIDTQRTSLNSGYVTFKLTWSDGSSGIDSRSAGYSQVSKCATPSPSPAPTATPTPTPSTNPTPTPTPTNTPTPSLAPSPTPTTCPTPGVVKNIKIQCPYCTPSPNPNQ